MKSIVSLVKSDYGNLDENLEKAITLAGNLTITEKDSIVIKINLCGARLPGSGTITSPLFLDSLLKYLTKNYCDHKIYIVESDATSAQPDLFIKWFGFAQILEKYNCKYINLTKQETTEKTISGRYFQRMAVPRIFENSFFITVPKLKTNLASNITCCLKNQFGCIPKPRKVIYHKHLDDVIVDSNLAMKPDFCIVDGIIAMGGDFGPGLGVPIPFGAVICGVDPVAVDALCAKLIGFRPWRVGHIRKSAGAGLGSMNYVLVGDPVPPIDFEVGWIRPRLIKLGSNLQHFRKKGD